jgi:hypothetical protein
LGGNGADAIGMMINEVCVKFTVLGGICFVSAWIAEACFKSSGLRQSAAWRKAYIKAIVRQVSRPTQRATKGFSGAKSPSFRHLNRRTPPTPLRIAYRRILGLVP